MIVRSFQEASSAVLEWLRERGYSTSVRYAHRQCYRQLDDYLKSSDSPFSREAAEAWVSGWSDCLAPHDQKSFKTALRRLFGVVETGAVPKSPRDRQGPARYNQLPEWAASEVDGYIASLASTLSPSSLDYERTCASHFMYFACDKGATCPQGITESTVLAYGSLDCQSESTRARRLSATRGMLARMNEAGTVPPHLAMLADDRYLKWSACYGPIPGLAPGGDFDAEGFLELAGKFVSALEGIGYARTQIKSSRKALDILFIFLSLNGLDCSSDNVAHWAARARESGGAQGKMWSRAALLFDSWLAEGTLRPETIFRDWGDPMEGLPDWASSVLRAYLSLREREGCAHSTLDTCRSACVRFLSFVCEAGAEGIGDVDAETVSRFCVADAKGHSTAAGAALYVSKVRSFLEWLADEGVVPHGLPFAANAAVAPKARVVQVLDDAQLAKAKDAITSAGTRMELRNAAMVAIGLEMGLRASDVVRIKLSDISWRDSSLTVTQRKTGVTVTLPLTATAGNAIVEYLRRGRPPCDAPELFVSHRTPIGPLGVSACRNAAISVFGKGEATFHSLRRTFATGMLRAGSGRREVSEALGHANERSATPYLSLDAERMRACAMTPTELGIGGGRRG